MELYTIDHDQVDDAPPPTRFNHIENDHTAPPPPGTTLSKSCIVRDPRDLAHFGKTYVHDYNAPWVMASAIEIDQELLFKARDDLLDFNLAADAMSVTLHAMNFCGVGAVFGERGAGRSAFLELLWQGLQRRQAEDHAREITKYIAQSCCCCRYIAYCCWRYCMPSRVDYGGSGTLGGYYILCKIECANLLSSDRVWGTILDALWAAIDKEYGSWALPYLARVGAANYPRHGPVFLKFVICSIIKLCVILLLLLIIISLVVRSNRRGDIATTMMHKVIAFIGVVVSLYLVSIQVATASVVLISAFSYVLVACRQARRKKKVKEDARAEEESRWRSEKGGFHHKVFHEVEQIVAMLEVHVRHRRAWPLILRICLPQILDGLLCDIFFRCYAWPQVVISIDDLDKVPSPIATQFLEALTALSHFQAPVRHACPFKIIFAADPLILDHALGSYFSGSHSAYHPRQPLNVTQEVAAHAHAMTAQGERFLRSFVTVHFEMPPSALVNPGKRSAVASKLLNHIGVRAVGAPEAGDRPHRPSWCCAGRASGRRDPARHTVGIVVPESPGDIICAVTTDGVAVSVPTPTNASPGDIILANATSHPMRTWKQKYQRALQSAAIPRDCDPQFMSQKQWSKAAGRRLSFGGEFLPGDLVVFDTLAPFLPANPRRMWRVVSAFHVAQRIARSKRLASCHSLPWRKLLLRFVLAGERWPLRFACLRHVASRRGAAWRTINPHKLSTMTPSTLLADIYECIADLILYQAADLRPLLILDDGSPQDLLQLLDTLTLDHLAQFDALARNNSSAVARAVAQVQPDDLLLSTIHAASKLQAGLSPAADYVAPRAFAQQPDARTVVDEDEKKDHGPAVAPFFFANPATSSSHLLTASSHALSQHAQHHFAALCVTPRDFLVSGPSSCSTIQLNEGEGDLEAPAVSSLSRVGEP